MQVQLRHFSLFLLSGVLFLFATEIKDSTHYSGTSGYMPTLIDFITPATLSSGAYTIEARIMPPGGGNHGAGVLFDFKIGVGRRAMFGIGYGGDGLIGRGGVAWHPWPSFLAKFRFLDESYGGPALAVGFSTYGSGGVSGNYRGFTYKSKGFFISASKGFGLTQNSAVDFHWDINLSLEEISEVPWPSTTVAIDFRFLKVLSTIIEYDFALNQIDIHESDGSYAKPHHGFLSLGFRWKVASTIVLQFDMQDIFQQRTAGSNSSQPQGWGRELKLRYLGHF